MIAEINPSKIYGEVYAPTSKSVAHRLLICSALSEGVSVIDSITFSEDILATLDCIKEMGGEYVIDGNKITMKGISSVVQTEEKTFDCRESGSTLRFFIPLLLLSETKQHFVGKGRLLERPQSVYEKICNEKGLCFSLSDKLTVKGKLSGGNYYVEGNISSQFITGLLFALSLCETDSRIYITSPLESRSYINLTISAMEEFGVSVVWEDEFVLYIKGNQKYENKNVIVEGDYSGSAFLDAFNVIGGKVNVLGLNDNSLQGDKIYKHYYKLLSYGSPRLDLSDCPDLAPILMTVAAQKNGARLIGTKRLKIKESDRGEAMSQELKKFGADIEVFENEIIVHKTKLHRPVEILNGHNDHRIVMSLAVLASVYGGKISDAHAVSKSFPDFFDVFKALNGEVNLYDN
ncbi:MAG: 3-phosphoshikimate 1-carboxyvinyltransferase [Clostridia bacterium]|nr:3-phosphoshikimate 1-carboxyvinyltransferase [Clostridia bacterium]